MTKTAQFYSPVSLNEAGRAEKLEADDICTLEVLFNNLNKLCNELSNLDNKLKEKNK